MIDTTGFLMIEPVGAPSLLPLIDDVTRKVAGMLAEASRSEYSYRGVHPCTGRGCSAASDSYDWFVDCGESAPRVSNALAVHYVAYHRGEVPESDLLLITASSAAPREPLPAVLAGRHADTD